MKKALVLGFAVVFLFSCANKKPDVVYLNKEKYNNKQINLDKKTKEEIKKVVSNEVYLPHTKAKKIEKIVKKEKLKTKEQVEKKVSKIITPYKEEKIKKETMLLKSPVTPIKQPDKILRIMLLPYVDDNNAFHSGEYLFVKVEEGKWILGNYVKNTKKTTKEYNPLVEVKK